MAEKKEPTQVPTSEPKALNPTPNEPPDPTLQTFAWRPGDPSIEVREASRDHTS